MANYAVNSGGSCAKVYELLDGMFNISITGCVDTKRLTRAAGDGYSLDLITSYSLSVMVTATV